MVFVHCGPFLAMALERPIFAAMALIAMQMYRCFHAILNLDNKENPAHEGIRLGSLVEIR
jgi:hypothetical protein